MHACLVFNDVKYMTGIVYIPGVTGSSLILSKSDSNVGNMLDHIFCMAALHFIFRQSDFKMQPWVHPSLPRILRDFPRRIPFMESVMPPLRRVYANHKFPWMDWHYNVGFLAAMRPVIQQTMQPLLVGGGSSHDVIIHFRCADTPFARQRAYKLLRYSWYARALGRINLASVSKIAIMSCTQHKAKQAQKQACQKYALLLAEQVRHMVPHATVELRCDSIDADFSTMAQAPVLIASISSMAIMAGLVSSGVTIIPSCSRKNPYHMIPERWIVVDSTSLALEHADVVNYFDTERVHQQLSEPLPE